MDPFKFHLISLCVCVDKLRASSQDKPEPRHKSQLWNSFLFIEMRMCAPDSPKCRVRLTIQSIGMSSSVQPSMRIMTRQSSLWAISITSSNMSARARPVRGAKPCAKKAFMQRAGMLKPGATIITLRTLSRTISRVGTRRQAWRSMKSLKTKTVVSAPTKSKRYCAKKGQPNLSLFFGGPDTTQFETLMICDENCLMKCSQSNLGKPLAPSALQLDEAHARIGLHDFRTPER